MKLNLVLVDHPPHPHPDPTPSWFLETLSLSLTACLIINGMRNWNSGNGLEGREKKKKGKRKATGKQAGRVIKNG